MSTDIGKYTPPSDELLEVLGMRLIDIQNKLMLQMMAKESDCEYIQFNAINGFNSKTYQLTCCLKEIE